MAILPHLRPVPETPSERIPPLENGDRLTRDEFERRYEAMPQVKKAELIEGVVYMPSPVSHLRHGGPHFDLIGWLSVYRSATPGISGGDNSSLRLDLDNEPQPDGFLMVLPEYGGQAIIDEDGYIEGAPELVAEVAASSASYDLGVKLQAYRRNRVREYVVWRVLDREIDWFSLRGQRYEPLGPGADGYLRSEVLPGLRLDPGGMVARDMQAVSRVAQEGIATDEHAAFVRKLQAAEAARG